MEPTLPKNVNKFEKGNLCFLPTILIDLLYIVEDQDGDLVRCRKLDAPPNQLELISSQKLVLLAGEQERILPQDIGLAIHQQRVITFSNIKKKVPSISKKRPTPMGELQKVLKKSSFEEILLLLAESQIPEEPPPQSQSQPQSEEEV